jgi:hypothetical protein
MSNSPEHASSTAAAATGPTKRKSSRAASQLGLERLYRKRAIDRENQRELRYAIMYCSPVWKAEF